jgi:hypothetical protein
VKRPGFREVVIGAATYGAYLAVRRAVLTETGRRRAAANAERVAEIERRLAIAVEPRVQDVALRSPRLVHAFNAGYAVANVSLSVGWLWLLYRRGDPGYRRERRAAVASYLGALPVFLLLPTAPPRTLDGYVDTIAHSGIDIEHPLLLRFYNPIAAMPSLHVAFATVTGAGLARRSASPLGAAGWTAYPAVVAAVVVATGNHFVLDCAGGAVLGALARRLTR